MPGLEHIRGLTRLNTLQLDDTPVKNAGFKPARGVDTTQELHLSCTPIRTPGWRT